MSITGYQIVLLVLLQAAPASDLNLGSTRQTAPQLAVTIELAGSSWIVPDEHRYELQRETHEDGQRVRYFKRVQP